MKYEGKIYGKVGGKYIELDYPQDLKEFVKRLNEELDYRQDIKEFVKRLNEELDRRVGASIQARYECVDSGFLHATIAAEAATSAFHTIKEIIKHLYPTT